MTYSVGSNGTIVTEHFGKELSVFYSDGGSFVMLKDASDVIEDKRSGTIAIHRLEA